MCPFFLFLFFFFGERRQLCFGQAAAAHPSVAPGMWKENLFPRPWLHIMGKTVNERDQLNSAEYGNNFKLRLGNTSRYIFRIDVRSQTEIKGTPKLASFMLYLEKSRVP